MGFPMQWLSEFLEFFLHLDTQLEGLIRQYGAATYGILFAIIFAETGLVFMPFLPGDSLLFVAGIFSHPGNIGLNPWILTLTLMAAAFLGDNFNYMIGKKYGRNLFKHERSRFLKPSHLHKTEEFFARHGPKTIILARFVPIVRTLSPFVAGMCAMDRRTFVMYDILGAGLWVGGCVWAGYFFGRIPFVRENFEIVIVGIVLLSAVPMTFEFIKARRRRAAHKAPSVESS